MGRVIPPGAPNSSASRSPSHPWRAHRHYPAGRAKQNPHRVWGFYLVCKNRYSNPRHSITGFDKIVWVRCMLRTGLPWMANSGVLCEIWKIEPRTDFELCLFIHRSNATPYRHASLIEASHFSVNVILHPWSEVCL